MARMWCGLLLRTRADGARACSSSAAADGLEGPPRTRPYWRYVRRLVRGEPGPPYAHVCQVGDPVLRAVAAPVEPAQLARPELQQLVQRLVQVMRRRRCVGLSAPQLGVPLQVLALELPEALFHACAPRLRELRQMEPFPLRVFVNPSLRVLDSSLITFPEGCESVAGFLAYVPRFQAVQISGAGGGLVWTDSPQLWEPTKGLPKTSGGRRREASLRGSRRSAGLRRARLVGREAPRGWGRGLGGVPIVLSRLAWSLLFVFGGSRD